MVAIRVKGGWGKVHATRETAVEHFKNAVRKHGRKAVEFLVTTDIRQAMAFASGTVKRARKGR